MDSLPSYFDQNPVILNELDGTLRRDVPQQLIEDGAAWVMLRRYIPKSIARGFERDLREISRSLVYVDGVAALSEDYIEQRDAVAYRRVEAHLMDWSYLDNDGRKLALVAGSLDCIPDVHTNAILFSVESFTRPRSDEESFRLGKESRSGDNGGLNGHRPADNDALLNAQVLA